MSLIFDVILPIWVTGLPIVVLLGVFGFLGEAFDVDSSYGYLTAKGKIQATKFFTRDLIFWPIALPVYAFHGLVILRKKYKGWKVEANQEALKDLHQQLSVLESSIAKRERLNKDARSARKKYEDLTQKSSV